MCVWMRLNWPSGKSLWEVILISMLERLLPSVRGFEFGARKAIKLYLAFSALPTILNLCCCPNCCLDGRRGNWLFGNDPALFTCLTDCQWHRCWQMLTMSRSIGNADTGSTRLVQIQQVWCFLGIWHLLPVLSQGTCDYISNQETMLKRVPWHSSSLSPAPNNTVVVHWLCVPSALPWVVSVPGASLISGS